MNQEVIIETLKNTGIKVAGFLAGRTAAKFVAKTVNKDGTNVTIGKIAPFALAGACVAGSQMLHVDAPVEARSFLEGFTMGALYQGLDGYGLPAKLDTAVGLSGGGMGNAGIEFTDSQNPEILFDDELHGIEEGDWSNDNGRQDENDYAVLLQGGGYGQQERAAHRMLA